MTLVQPLTTLLRLLPSGVRRALYTTIAMLGAAIAVLGSFGVTDLGPITAAQALQAYAYLAPVAGVVAVANVKPSPPGVELIGHDEDVDLSSFEPVGDIEDVYGQSAW